MNTNLTEIIKNNQNLFITVVIILATILLMVLIHQVLKKIFKLIKKKPSNIKKIKNLEQPLLLIIVILGSQAIIGTYLKNYPTIHSNLNNFLITISIIIVTYMLGVISSVFLENWSKKLKEKKHEETHEGIVPLMKSVVNILLGLLALIFVLQTWNVSVGALLTSLGIAGVILGFAFRDTLTNVFGGISLVMDDTFKKGDLIELSDGEMGFVMETSLRSTKLKNFDLEEVYIPNSVLANTKITNYAQPTKSIRIKVLMPVAIGTDVSKVEKLVMKMLEKRTDILSYPKPKFYFVKVQEYYLELAICFFINDFHDLFVKKSDLTKAIYELLLKNKIEIPYPARKIYQDQKKVHA